MSYCLNPNCPSAASNPIGAKFCQSCGSKLLLLERYHALQLIGQGGFGRTFLAVDEHQPSKPRCVIKQFFPQARGITNTQKAAELFEQEAMRLEMLGKHPQIPQFLGHFEQDKYQYLVQEYIDGPNLARVLETEGTFSEQQIRDLLHCLLPVIDFIHSKNIIHRDIKPENLIRRNDEQLVLVDFGAAKYATGTALARTGTVIGSAGYAAPEQAGGKAVFSSDLYSLGVTCLHLLTQTEPFDLYSFSDATWVWRNYLPRPISRQLGRVLDTMVEMATSRRFQSAADVLKALNSPLYLGTRTPEVTFPQSLHAASPGVVPESQPPMQHWRGVYSLKGHTQAIRSLAITPDGEILASGSDDKTIKLWQLKTGRELVTLRGHSKPVNSLAMSQDGEILASGSEDKTLKLWQLSTGLQIGAITLGGWFSGDSGCVYAIAISVQEQILVSLSKSGAVKLWNLRTGQEISRLKGDTSWVQSIAISPNGQLLASGSGDTIKLWNLGTGREIGVLKGHNSWVRTVAFSPHGQILASGSDDATIKLWHLRTGKELGTLKGHTRPIHSVVFACAGHLAVRDRAGKRDADFEELAFSVNDSQASAAPVVNSFFNNQEQGVGQILASSSDDRRVKLWDTSTGQELCTFTGHSSWMHAIALSPDEQILASGSSDSLIYIWQCDAVSQR
jgi:WD40 repeat protein